MVAAESSNQNFFSTTLSSSISDADTTIPLSDLGNLTSPAYLVIDPESDTKREVIYADGTWTGAAAVLSTAANRGIDGSASGAQSHNSGTTVVSVPLKQHLEDIHDRVNVHVHDGTTDDSAVDTSDLTGHDKTAHDALSLDHGLLTGLGDDDHTQYLNSTRHDSEDHSTALSTAVLDDLSDFTETTPALGDAVVYDGSEYVNAPVGLRQIVTFTADGTFTKADYPWLRAVKVTVVGGGGGGGGCTSTGSNAAAVGRCGGGGGTAIKFLAVGDLSAGETVTVGAGGSGGAAGNNSGSDGGNSAFGSHCTGNGGSGGSGGGATTISPAYSGSGEEGGTATGGDINTRGGGSGPAIRGGRSAWTGPAGGSTLGGGSRGNGVLDSAAAGTNVTGIGGGAAGGASANNSGAAGGGTGADGIVIVELYG